MDSVLIFADRALYNDNQLAEAYEIRGVYYYVNGKIEQVFKELDKALKYNPNYWEAYRDLSLVYLWDINNLDYVRAIENLNKAVNINHGSELPSLLRSLGDGYGLFAGFYEKANFYYQEAFKLDRDSASYYSALASLEESFGNYEDAVELWEKVCAVDSNNTYALKSLGWDYIFQSQNEKSLKYFKKYVEKPEVSQQGRLNNMQRIGYVYWLNGFKKEADYYFNEQKKYCEESIKMKRSYAIIELGAYYDLAGVYAFMGDRDKAYENLRAWARLPVCPIWWVTFLKDDPLFNNLRDEPEFQQIVRDMESKYQAEHERVRKWMEENGML
jgi:tetratricopeptide (TPR) repeat protein